MMYDKILCFVRRFKERTISLDLRYFLVFLSVRLSSVWLVKTWFVPDEYWQSMEVAHRLVFGYGYLTWEWAEGIRSYLHPLLIAGLYEVLRLLGLDNVSLLIMMPRLCQAVFSAYSDLKFFHWSGRQRWAAFTIATSWFWFYTGSRTLVNTLEANLCTVALSHYPWPGQEHRSRDWSFLVWAALACAARPTAALLWLPLVLHQVLCCDPTAGARRRLILRYMCVGGGALAACSLLDSLCHGEPLLTPWRFLRANVLRDVGSWYGEHPWHWYMTVGLPSVLGAYALPCALAAFETVRRPAERRADLLLLATAAFVVAVLSVLPHKELRFLSPVLPCALHLSAGRLSRWSRRAPRVLLWLAAGTLLLANVLPAAYLGSVHQRGTLLAMRPLAELAAARPNDTSILFLMPCHSAPMYSHLHVNVPVRFLTCEPPPPGDLPPAEKYTDEAERFYERPSEWLHAEYPAHGSLPLPSHIVMFDTLAAKPGPASLLSRYRLLHSFPHSPTPISSRHGHQVLVHQHRDY